MLNLYKIGFNYASHSFFYNAENRCGSSRFKCKTNDQCVSSFQVCDKIRDCPDASDENPCGKDILV